MSKVEMFLKLVNPMDSEQLVDMSQSMIDEIRSDVLIHDTEEKRAEPLMEIMLNYGLVDESELVEETVS